MGRRFALLILATALPAGADEPPKPVSPLSAPPPSASPPYEFTCWQNGVRIFTESDVRSVAWVAGVPTLQKADGSLVTLSIGGQPPAGICTLRRPGGR